MAGFDMSDFPRLLAVLAAFVGQIAHVFKKRVEEGKDGDVSEFAVFRRWFLEKFFSRTIPAFAVAASVALVLQVEGASLPISLLNAFVAGFAADSAVNRPGNGS